MRAIGNIIWFIFGGLVMGLSWWLLGLVFYISIIGIPWGRSAFMLGTFSFFPFGKTVVSRKELLNKKDIGTGFFGSVGNVIWFLLAGIWLAIGHVISGIFYFITIIGFPFGIQHFKLAEASLFPVGKEVVPKEVARAAKRRN